MGGIHALNFYVAWIASLISYEYIQHKHKQNNTPCRNGYLLVAEPTESNSNYESDEDSDASLAGNIEHRRLLEDAHPAHTPIEVESVEVIQNDVVMNEAPEKKRRWGAQIIYPFLRAMSRPTVIFIIVSTVIFFHSSFMKYLFQSNHFFNPFWTPPIQDYAPVGTSINASCILGHYKFNQSDASEYLTQTRIVAGWGSNLILWSEAAVVLPDESRKQILFARILKITKTHNTTVGISYYMPIQAPSQMVQGNFFALIGPTGLLYEYQKVHPVFGVETGTAPGEGSMPVVEVPGVGRVGIGVCLDLDFEGWAKTAGREKAQIVLNPAWNWGATGALHTLHARHRAVEQGFTLFRCASYSLSGIYNPDFTIAHERPTPVGEGWEYAIKLVSLKVGERARVGTLYAMWGDWIIVLSVLLLFAALLQEMKGRWSVIRRRHSIETL
ncbi:carbon-nitrogen hydrolase [Paraphysoderma sedebokerense]|nr:carbon-nitrogen hydrolase [Paraphysoderma sedebokerense]